jgi:hypothetical protein
MFASFSGANKVAPGAAKSQGREEVAQNRPDADVPFLLRLEFW